MFKNLWLADIVLQVLNSERSTILNNDRDPIAFHSARYPFLAEATTEQMRERLNAVEALRDASDAV